MKEISQICEQKKSFYDSCVEGYFESYRNDINKTITKIADKNISQSNGKLRKSKL